MRLHCYAITIVRVEINIYLQQVFLLQLRNPEQVLRCLRHHFRILSSERTGSRFSSEIESLHFQEILFNLLSSSHHSLSSLRANTNTKCVPDSSEFSSSFEKRFHIHSGGE